jgi:hypothetical protein
MRARDVVGRRIVEMRQTRTYDHGIGQSFMEFDRLILDDGSQIVFDHTCFSDRQGYAQDAVIAYHIKKGDA